VPGVLGNWCAGAALEIQSASAFVKYELSRRKLVVFQEVACTWQRLQTALQESLVHEIRLASLHAVTA